VPATRGSGCGPERRGHTAPWAPLVCGTPARKGPYQQSDAGIALAAGRDSNVSSTTANGHTDAGLGQIQVQSGQQFDAALKAEAHLFLTSSRTRDSFESVTSAYSCSPVVVRVALSESSTLAAVLVVYLGRRRFAQHQDRLLYLLTFFAEFGEHLVNVHTAQVYLDFAPVIWRALL